MSLAAVMNPQIPRYAPPGGSGFSGRGPGIYTVNYTIGGIYAGTYPFQVRIPTGYNNNTPAKTLYMLDGSGSRGTDGTTQMTGELAIDIEADAFPVICIYTQWQASGPNGGREAAYPMIEAIRQAVEGEWNCDTSRRYIVGFSLGALIGWESLYIYPTMFAACCFAECYLNHLAVGFAGGYTVTPATDTQAAKDVAIHAPLTAIRQFWNTDDSIITASFSDTADAGYTAAGHADHAYYNTGTGGHSPNTMMAASGATHFTNWLFTKSR